MRIILLNPSAGTLLNPLHTYSKSRNDTHTDKCKYTHTHTYSHTMSTSATGVDSCPPCGQFFVCHLVSFLFCKVDIKFIAPPGRKQSVCMCVCV